jgi:hypothetical protein
MTPPFAHTDFDSKPIGVDTHKGRFGDVSIETCKECGANWQRDAAPRGSGFSALTSSRFTSTAL